MERLVPQELEKRGDVHKIVLDWCSCDGPATSGIESAYSSRALCLLGSNIVRLIDHETVKFQLVKWMMSRAPFMGDDGWSCKYNVVSRQGCGIRVSGPVLAMVDEYAQPSW